jgi:hypothetical protein
MNEASRSNGPTREFVGGQICFDSLIRNAEIDLGHQQCSCYRRRKARHQKAVIAPCVGTGDRAAREAPDTVGDQPFIADGLVPIATGLAAERQGHRQIRGVSLDIRRSYRQYRTRNLSRPATGAVCPFNDLDPLLNYG